LKPFPEPATAAEFRAKSLILASSITYQIVLLWHAACIRRGQFRSTIASAEINELRSNPNHGVGADQWRARTSQDKTGQERMRLEMEQTNQKIFGVGQPNREEAALLAFNPRTIAGANLAEVAHEARNMVAALGLYCDLLGEPGVLTATHQHYGSELKMVAAASRHLVERLMDLGGAENAITSPYSNTAQIESTATLPEETANNSKATRYWDEMPPKLIGDLAWELQMNRNLLASLAGPSITVTIDSVGGAHPVRLNSENLTRVLINLVKNAIDAMPDGGRIQLILRACPSGPGHDERLLLNFEDNGFGIPPPALEKIFESGYTTRSKTG
jgi:signal transduction histidine kinase